MDVLLTRVADLKLDCPPVEKLLASFIARAVIDEVLPPSYIADKLSSTDVPENALTIVQQAAVLCRSVVAAVCPVANVF